MLSLVSTPIGNLKDISERALDTLRSADLILCEDTRHSQILLKHYEIEKPLKSFHQFNEKKNEDEIIQQLKQSAKIALISDAGTPALCDPGQRLVTRCHEEEIQVSAIPGASAVITALCLSGFEVPPYQFGGFLPKKLAQLRTTLVHALVYPGVTVFFDTPHHIQDTLDMLKDLAPMRRLCIARELTKMYEQVSVGTAETIKCIHKGEFCLVIDRGDVPHGDLKALAEQLVQQFALSLKDAIKLAAEIGGVNKQEFYRDWHSDSS